MSIVLAKFYIVFVNLVHKTPYFVNAGSLMVIVDFKASCNEL